MNMMQNTNIPVMKGIIECAEIFGISRHYCRQLALTGAVRAVRVGRGKILINVQSMRNRSSPADASKTTTRTLHPAKERSRSMK